MTVLSLRVYILDGGPLGILTSLDQMESFRDFS